MKAIERRELNSCRLRCDFCQSLLEVETSDFKVNRANYINCSFERIITGYSNNLLEYYFICPICLRNNYIREDKISSSCSKNFQYNLHEEHKKEIDILEKEVDKYIKEHEEDIKKMKEDNNKLLLRIENRNNNK